MIDHQEKIVSWFARYEVAQVKASSWCSLSTLFADSSIQDIWHYSFTSSNLVLLLVCSKFYFIWYLHLYFDESLFIISIKDLVFVKKKKSINYPLLLLGINSLLALLKRDNGAKE